MKPKLIIVLYVLAGVANLAAQALELRELYLYSKPLLMPLLILYVYVIAAGTVTFPGLLLAGALVFSWIGDLLLMYQGDEVFFLGGIGAFLVAQVIYILTLYRSAYRKPSVAPGPAVPFVIYAAVLLVILLPETGSLAMPVGIYGLCLMGMAVMANCRKPVTTTASYQWALAGAVLFVISDSVLAIDRFAREIPYAGFWVMLTYIPAQYFLVRGILAHRS